MNINSMGRVSDYIKTTQLEMKWQQRKADPLMPKAGEDSLVSQMMKQNAETEKGARLNRIENKMKTGERLSTTEMEYLRKNAPAMYEKAVKIEREREEYRRALENCKTKEEVRQLNMSRMGQLLSEAKSVANNPNIPEDKKLELLDEIASRAMAMSNEFAEFVVSEEYANLPDEDDINEENAAKASEKNDAAEAALLENSDNLEQILEAIDAALPGAAKADDSPDSAGLAAEGANSGKEAYLSGKIGTGKGTYVADTAGPGSSSNKTEGKAEKVSVGGTPDTGKKAYGAYGKPDGPSAIDEEKTTGTKPKKTIKA